MSDHIPFDIQVEIIKKLPAKSLLKFRAVSKPWKCLIDSAKFIADYNPRSQHLYIHSFRRNHPPFNRSAYNRSGYTLKCEYPPKLVKVIDDDTFPQHKISLTVPSSCVNMYRYVIGNYSHGLFCLFGYNPDRDGKLIYMAVIWNPSIRKSVDIVVPNMGTKRIDCFGVCRETNEPKILKIEKIAVDMETSATFCPYNYKVEVFTLSSGLWRTPLSKLPDKWFHLKWGNYPVVIDGLLYWFASYDGSYIIVSFDLTIEEFKHVYLPDKLALDDEKHFNYRPIHKLRESLAVVQYELKADKQVYRVWMMDNSVSKSFTEIFNINLPYASLRRIHGFRNNGELIMEIRDGDDDSVMLVVCEPGSERINRLGISVDCRGTFFVSSYKESLLLHDQPNTHIN